MRNYAVTTSCLFHAFLYCSVKCDECGGGGGGGGGIVIILVMVVVIVVMAVFLISKEFE